MVAIPLLRHNGTLTEGSGITDRSSYSLICFVSKYQVGEYLCVSVEQFALLDIDRHSIPIQQRLEQGLSLSGKVNLEGQYGGPLYDSVVVAQNLETSVESQYRYLILPTGRVLLHCMSSFLMTILFRAKVVS